MEMFYKNELAENFDEFFANTDLRTYTNQLLQSLLPAATPDNHKS